MSPTDDERSLRILIVEDEALLALQLEDDLASWGHEVVGHAMCSQRAVELAERTMPDLALVDVHLADGPTGVRVANALSAAGGITVVFLTANAKRIPEHFAGATGVIAKPYTAHGLRRAVAFLAALLRGRAAPPPPPCLQLLPDGEAACGRLSVGSSRPASADHRGAPAPTRSEQRAQD
jgi:CheY-like chemotaxis protein